jgi:hypothetical protein
MPGQCARTDRDEDDCGQHAEGESAGKRQEAAVPHRHPVGAPLHQQRVVHVEMALQPKGQRLTHQADDEEHRRRDSGYPQRRKPRPPAQTEHEDAEQRKGRVEHQLQRQGPRGIQTGLEVLREVGLHQRQVGEQLDRVCHHPGAVVSPLRLDSRVLQIDGAQQKGAEQKDNQVAWKNPQKSVHGKYFGVGQFTCGAVFGDRIHVRQVQQEAAEREEHNEPLAADADLESLRNSRRIVRADVQNKYADAGDSAKPIESDDS